MRKLIVLLICSLFTVQIVYANMHTPAQDITYDTSVFPDGAASTVQEALDYLGIHVGQGTNWGNIEGTLSNQTDLWNALQSNITETNATWAIVTSVTNGSSLHTELWRALNVGPGASTTITITPSTSITMSAVAAEYYNIKPASAGDKSATNSGTSTSVDSGTTGSTTAANELWSVSLGSAGSFPISGITNGFRIVGQASDGGGALLGEKYATATGTANSGGSIGFTSPWAGVVGTFIQVSFPRDHLFFFKLIGKQ